MREIKFRAWDGSRIIPQQALYWDVEKFIAGVWDYHETHIIEGHVVEIMQYTGLKDKKGVEIYEGDVMYYPDHKGYVVVEYILDMFHLKSLKLPNLSPGNFRLSTLCEKLEVIGNIYENQELLGEVGK